MTASTRPRGRRARRGALAVVSLAALFALSHCTCLVRSVGGAFSRKPHEMKGGASALADTLVTAAFADVDAKSLNDYHVHIVGLGAGDSGAWVNPDMQSWTSPIKRFKFSVYKSAAGIESEEGADRVYVERLVALARATDQHGRFFIMAFDFHHRPDGSINHEKSEFYTPNAYVFALAAEFPDVFVPVMSVHPYRGDAVAELDRWAAQGGRLVKWLPNAMGIDPADAKCDPSYAAMRRLGLTLITHAGEEKAVEAEEDQKLGNPLLLRRALDQGVRVIVAHCASLGDNQDLDDPARPLVSNFQLFMRLMEEPRYVGLLYGEVSAMIQWNRLGEPLRTILARGDLHERLVNGSDYPLPAINALVSTDDLEDDGYISEAEREALNEIYDFNPLLFDYVLKRTLKHPDTGARLPPSVFTRVLPDPAPVETAPATTPARQD